MGSYEATIGILAAELARVEEVFGTLSPDEWQFPTKLVPVDPALPHWTVFELAGHFDISIGLTRMLIDGRDDLQPARDRTSFFINPRSETAPVVYDYAFTMVRGKAPADMPHALHDTFSGVISQARSVPERTVGPGYFAPMRVDEFVASRIVEAVVHGIDLTQALGATTSRPATGSGRPRRSLTTCWRGEPWGAARRSCRTTWTGSWRRPGGRCSRTTGCR